jgi:molecular chaperone Hsp33
VNTPRLQDSVLRAMTDDGAFRVITVRTTDTVDRALGKQSAWGRNGRYLGELLTGAVLVRETMAPTHRVQGFFRTRDKRGQLIADAHPDGGNRALLARQEGVTEIALEGGTLEMMRTLYTGELHRGVVPIPNSGGLSAALMAYMADSEQVASMIAVSCVLDGERVRAAGGYIVQLLPEVGRGPLAVMTERLREFQEIDGLLASLDADPVPLLDELLYGMPFTRLEQSPLRFECRCNAVRVMSALASLGRSELADLVKQGVPIELGCDYCGQQYVVSPLELQGLLQES